MHYDNGGKARTKALIAIVSTLVMAIVFALGLTRTARADEPTPAKISNAVLSEMAEPTFGGTPSTSCTLTVNFANDYYPSEGDATRSIEIPNTVLEWSEDGQYMAEGSKFSVDHKLTVTATVGETIKLPAAPTRDGYTFEFWKGSEYAAGADYKVEGDHAFTAEWARNTPSKTGSTTQTPTSATTRTTASTTSSTLAKTGDTTSLVSMAALALSSGACKGAAQKRRAARGCSHRH